MIKFFSDAKFINSYVYTFMCMVGGLMAIVIVLMLADSNNITKNVACTRGELAINNTVMVVKLHCDNIPNAYVTDSDVMYQLLTKNPDHLTCDVHTNGRAYNCRSE